MHFRCATVNSVHYVYKMYDLYHHVFVHRSSISICAESALDLVFLLVAYLQLTMIHWITQMYWGINNFILRSCVSNCLSIQKFFKTFVYTILYLFAPSIFATVYLLWHDHRERHDTATDESGEQYSSSSDSSDDTAPLLDQNNTPSEKNNSSPPPETDTLPEPGRGGSILGSRSESLSQEHWHVVVQDQAYITLESEIRRPTVESEEPLVPSKLWSSISAYHKPVSTILLC